MMHVAKTPRMASLAITAKCNLRCLYCSHFTSAGDVLEDLPTEEWLNFFEEMGRCNVMNITLEGGEPFIRDDICEIIEGIVKNRMRYSILSNGTLLTDEIVEFMQKTHRCDYVQISIDGSTAEVHEKSRGKGTFSKAVNAINLLKKNSIPVTVRVTVNHYNVSDLTNIARFLLEDLAIPDFSTNSAKFFGVCRENADKIELTTEDQGIAMGSLLQLNHKYKGRINAQAGPLAEARMWMDMYNKAVRGAINNNQILNAHLTSCGGVFKKIGIRADGVIVPCTLLPQIELGRINRDNLEEIWQNHPMLNELRKRREIDLSKFQFCKDCRFMPYCRGGCPGVAAMYEDDFFCPSPDSCLKHYLEHGGILPENNIFIGDLV